MEHFEHQLDCNRNWELEIEMESHWSTSLFTSCVYRLIWLSLIILHLIISIIYHVNATLALIIIQLSSYHFSWKLSPTQAQAQPFQSLVSISWKSSYDSCKVHGGLWKLKKKNYTKYIQQEAMNVIDIEMPKSSTRNLNYVTSLTEYLQLLPSQLRPHQRPDKSGIRSQHLTSLM